MSFIIFSVLHIPAQAEDQPAYDVVAVLDPTTRAAQKYLAVLMVSLHRRLGAKGSYLPLWRVSDRIL